LELFILPNLAQHTTIMNIGSKKFLFFRNLKADLELENGLVLGRRASRA
jgi:16S rRNA G527 N7-methylase RsmG